MRGLAESFAPVVTIVGKTWDLHIEKVTRVSREENLRMIEESVSFLVRQGKEVVYDAEHFFDAYDAHPDYALQCLRAAESGGAAWLTPCDTNGATLPGRVARVMRDVRAAIPSTPLGIHTHNDAECAVANSLAKKVASATGESEIVTFVVHCGGFTAFLAGVGALAARFAKRA